MPLRRALAGAFVSLAMISGGGRARAESSYARELVKTARALEADHHEDAALRRYMEALALDPSLEDAYLGLGDLRARRGDWREAERVYDVALTHLPSSVAARVGRARMRFSLGRRQEAIRDVVEGHEGEISAWRTVVGFYDGTTEAPAKLALWRRIASLADELHDEDVMREAGKRIRALTLVVGSADPASSPIDPGPVRRAIARAAGR